ncbi:MAG: hypothetical protein UU61_C0008G0006 [Parcubacteria group bacterium GW2011_GWB1_41_4]|nr:MAG: hypothetical protein UU61_C0008G0006 [Parcubacteria group bacterium GW2011_GWB1_41_4]
MSHPKTKISKEEFLERLKDFPAWLLDFMGEKGIPDEIDRGVLDKLGESLRQEFLRISDNPTEIPDSGVFGLHENGTGIYYAVLDRFFEIRDNEMSLHELSMDKYLEIVGEDDTLRKIWLDYFGTNSIWGDRFDKLVEYLREYQRSFPESTAEELESDSGERLRIFNITGKVATAYQESEIKEESEVSLK